jgi:UDP-N-acetylmuramate-alanine ligase
VFADAAAVSDAFETWIRSTAAARAAAGGTPATLIANVADPNVAALCRELRADWPGRLVLTAVVDAPAQRLDGFARGLADEFASESRGAEPVPVLLGRIAAADTTGTSVELYSRALLGEPRTIQLATAGRHNVANALGVLGAARVLDVSADAALEGLASFQGVGRRLEHKGEAGGVAVYDDYGHHPTAIRATIAALRQREPDRRLWAVYEPLTYHRTAAMLDDFAGVLATADAVAVADIWAGRDPDTTVASAAALAAAVAARRPEITSAAPGSVEDTAAWLAGKVRPGDVVLVMGGGRSYRIGELLLERLAARPRA